MKRLAPDQLAELRRFPTPTISNAIERFDIRPRHLGFLPWQVRALFPQMPPTVGYAVTCEFRAASLRPAGQPDLTADYYRSIQAQPGPKVAVAEDLDEPAGVGALFGEVNANVHIRLGCIGHITNGAARDLAEVEALGFSYFAAGACVSHGYVHVVKFGQPVTIAGVVIRPGDLIHADRHGVCIIPDEVAEALADAAAEVERIERPLIEFCKASTFDLEEYLEMRAAMARPLRE